MPDARPRQDRSAFTLIELLLVLGIMAAVAGISWPLLMRPLAQSVVQGAAQGLAEQLVNTRIRAIEESRVYELRWKPGTGEFEIKAQHEHRHQAVLSRQSNQFDGSGNSLVAANTTANRGLNESRLNEISQRAAAPTHVHERLVEAVRFESAELIKQLREQVGMDEHGRPNPNGANASPLTSNALAGDEPELPGRDALRKIDEINRQRFEKKDASGRREFEIHWSHPVRFYPDGTTSNGKWALLSEDLNRIEVTLRGMTGTVSVSKVRPLKLAAEEPIPGIANPDGSPSSPTNQSPQQRMMQPPATRQPTTQNQAVRF